MFLNYMLLVIAEHSLWTEAEACHLNPHVTRPRAVLGPSVGWWVVGGGPCGHGSGDSAVPAWPGPAPAARQLSSGETAGSSTSGRAPWHVTRDSGMGWHDEPSRPPTTMMHLPQFLLICCVCAAAVSGIRSTETISFSHIQHISFLGHRPRQSFLSNCFNGWTPGQGRKRKELPLSDTFSSDQKDEKPKASGEVLYSENA